jgi:hypothetical protein
MPIKGRRATPERIDAVEEQARRLRAQILREWLQRGLVALKSADMGANFERMLGVTVKAWS